MTVSKPNDSDAPPCHGASGVAMPGWKRGMDVTVCACALPLLLITTVVMLFFTKGRHVFFRQQRIGLHGRCFVLYKFRTMAIAADAAPHRDHLDRLIRSNAPMQKMDSRNDPRLIRGGWLLRASGLDELPQILNVLRGEMSIVGPRPCLPYEYEAHLPWQRARYVSTPGLTGLWQVSGKNRSTFEQMVRLDLQYAERRSPWLDLKILLLTPAAIVVQIRDTRRSRRARSGCHQPSGETASPGNPSLVAQQLPGRHPVFGRLLEKERPSQP